MNKLEIINCIKNYLVEKPVKKAFIFGSFARNQNNFNDIDLLLELDYSHKLYQTLFNMNDELKILLGIKVDIVSANGLSKHIKPFIDNEKILIYEQS